MPELPEVETVVRDLRPLLVGKQMRAISTSTFSLRTKWSKKWEPSLIGKRIGAIRRRGKWMLLDLEPNGLLVIHLGMTGQLTVVPNDDVLGDHVHLRIDLDVDQLRFRDIRRFGSAVFYADEEAWTTQRKEPLGPEPFELKAKMFRDSLTSSQRSLKALLLDQKVVAGIGNIYADESLFAARLDPQRHGTTLTGRETERLRKSIVAVLSRAIEFRGSTIRNYVGGSGLKGGFQDEFQVYGRLKEPCRRCRTSISRIRLAGRSTHFCSKCQRVG